MTLTPEEIFQIKRRPSTCECCGQEIKDALAAIHEARSADRATAAGVGEDEA